MYALEQENPQRLVIVDIPLLYESELDSLFEQIIVVYVPRRVQLARLMERSGMKLEQAEDRLRSQMDIELKRRKANYVIDNSSDLQSAELQVARLWDRLGLI